MIEDRANWRPKIPSSKTTDVTSEEERFQNQTLRPIIKMQHDLLIVHFKQYMVSKKCVFDTLSDEQRSTFIQTSFRKDLPFRQTLIGLIVGHFTVEEYHQYTVLGNAINKRIVSIGMERILTSMDELAG